MKRFNLGAASLLALAAAVPLLMAPTGGFPSRPTFQQVTVSGAAATDIFVNSTGAGADQQVWRIRHNGATQWQFSAINDARTVSRNVLSATRAANAITAVDLGNVTDNPPATLNGQSLTATFLCTTACSVAGMQVGARARILKGTTTSRASTTTNSLDPDLQFTNMPAGTYAVSARIMFTSVGGGWSSQPFSSVALSGGGTGIETSGYQAAAPGGGSCGAAYTMTSIAVATAHGIGTYTCTSTGGGAMMYSWINLNYTPSATANFGLDWAQQTSNVTAATVMLGSYVEITRLN